MESLFTPVINKIKKLLDSQLQQRRQMSSATRINVRLETPIYEHQEIMLRVHRLLSW